MNGGEPFLLAWDITWLHEHMALSDNDVLGAGTMPLGGHSDDVVSGELSESPPAAGGSGILSMSQDKEFPETRMGG